MTPVNGSIYACKLLSPGALLIYNASPSQPRQSITVGSLPDAATIDTENGEIYVANWGSDNVTIIQLTTGRVLGSIPVGSEPDGILFDSATGFLYVANNASDNVTVINGASNTVADSVATGPGPAALAYDASTRTVYVANSGSDSLTAISDVTNAAVGTVPVGSGPVAIAVDPQSGTLYVANAGSGNVTVAPTEREAFGLTFTESGLPSGTSWSVTLNGTTESSLTSTISFTEPNGTYSFTVGSSPGYAASPSSGTITVSGAAVSEGITFTAGGLTQYAVTFTEAGLPPGTVWGVTLGGDQRATNTPSITFSLPNGTLGYALSDISGWHETTIPYTGSITVRGSAISEAMTFTQVTYTVPFTENGLPSGTSWSVTVNGVTHSSAAATVNFAEPNGTYAYSIADVPGWHQTALPYSGSVVVNGAAVSEPTLVFTQVTYAVTFTESGLPSATSWSMTLNGATKRSTTSTIVFEEPNGTYAFTVGSVSGYTASPLSGSIAVHASPVTESISFNTSSGGGGSSAGFLGLSGTTGYYLVGGIAILVVVGAAVALILRARRK